MRRSALCLTLTSLVIVFLTTYLSSVDNQAEATHFAFGTISWTRPRADRRVYFNIEVAYRHAYFGSPALGQTLWVAYLVFPETSNNLYDPNSWYYRNVEATVRNIYYADNPAWFYGSVNYTFNVPSSYPDRFRIFIYDCCRLSNILEANGDMDVYISSDVDLGRRTRSPVTTGFPREYFQVNEPVQFRIPAVSPDNFPLTYQIVPSGSGLSAPAPCGKSDVQISYNTWPYTVTCPTAGQQLTVDRNTGVVTWTPRVTGLYAIQLSISDGAAQTYLDFLMVVMAVCDSCNKPPRILTTTSSVTFFAGVEGTLTVTADDPNPGDSVTLLNNILPTGASFTQTVSGNPTTYILRWTPSVDQISVNVCFKALDSRGMYAFNQYCVLLEIKMSEYIFVSGIIRNFAPSHPDFNKPVTSTFNERDYVLDTLGPDDKPVFTSSVAPINAVSAFNTWFNDTELSQPMLLSIPLTYGANTHTSRRVFSFTESAWYPVKGKLLGASNPNSNNQFYTFEVHTYLEYLGGESYRFGSTDDLWVFIDNKKVTVKETVGSTVLDNSLVGLHAPNKQAVIDMDRIAPRLGLRRGENYKVDIFYASRQNSAPYFRMELSNSSTCNAITLINQDTSLVTVATAFDYPSIPTDPNSFQQSFSLLGKAERFAGGSGAPSAVRLISTSSASESGAMWVATNGVPTALKVLNGFQMTFTFRITKQAPTGSAEGFAFVIQAQSPSARGTEGGNLGYSGISSSIALEFDTLQTSGKSDPAYQHVSLHTRYDLPNDAMENNLYYPLGSSYVGNIPDLPFTFDNGTDHRVRIDFIPGPSRSWMRVFINDVIRPIFEAQLDTPSLNRAFSSGAAYVGFTSSSGDLSRANVDISKMKMVIVPALASETTLTTTPPQVVAGGQGVVVAQLRDACKQALSVLNEIPKFSATLSHATSPSVPPVPVTIADIGGGRYSFTYSPRIAGVYRLDVSYATIPGVFSPIQGSPWTVTVVSAPSSLARSTYEYGLLPVRWSNPIDSFGFDCVAVTSTGLLAPTVSGYDSRYTFHIPPVRSTDPTFTQWFGAQPVGTSFSCAITSRFISPGHTLTTSQQADKAFIQTLLGATDLATSTSFAAIFTKTGASTVTRHVTRQNVIDSSGRLDPTGRINHTFTPAGHTLIADSSALSPGGYSYIQVVPAQFRVQTGFTGVVGVLTRDSFGNRQTQGDSTPPVMTFTPTLPIFTQPGAIESGNYEGIFNGTTTGIYSLTVSLGGQPIQTSMNVYVVSGPAYAPNSVIFQVPPTVIAATTGTFRLQLRDASNNQVILESPTDIVTCSLVPVPSTSSAHLTPVNVPVTPVWDADNRQYTMSFSTPIAATYTISLTINGLLHAPSSSTTISVIPSGVSTQSVAYGGNGPTDITVMPAQTGTAGTLQRIYIQARDEHNNNRGTENNKNGLGSDQHFRAYFTPNVNDRTGQSVNGLVASYDSNGRYVVEFSPRFTTNVSVSVVLGDSDAPVHRIILPAGNTMPFLISNIQPGPLAATMTSLLEEVVSPAALTNAVAGGIYRTYVDVKDAYNNSRAGITIPSTELIATFAVSSTASVPIAPTVSFPLGSCTSVPTTPTPIGGGSRITGKCALEAIGYIAGTYSLSVRSSLELGQPHILASPREVTIVPAATNPANCTVVSATGSGGGSSTGSTSDFIGAGGDSKTAWIQSRDIYGNAKDGSTDSFECIVLTSAGTVHATITSTLNVAQKRHECTFTIPPQGTPPTYTLSVKHVGTGQTFFTTTNPVRSPPDQNYAVLSSNLPNQVAAGDSLNFIVLDRQSNGDPKTDSYVLNVVIRIRERSATSGDPKTNNGVILQEASLSLTPRTDQSTYDGSLLITRPGDVQLFIYSSSVLAKYNIDNGPYVTLAVTGALSAPMSTVDTPWPTTALQVGQPFVWTVRPKDIYGNFLSDKASSPGTLIATTTPQITGVWISETKMYNFTYTSTQPGIQMISILHGEALVASRSYQLVFAAGSASPVNCRLSPSASNPNVGFGSSLAVAGEPFTVYFFAFDDYNNSVSLTSSTLNTFIFTFADPLVDMSTSVKTVLLGNVASITFTPKTATYSGFALGGTGPGNAPINNGATYLLRVRSGSASGPQSSVIGNFDATIDDEVSFTLTIRDSIGNRWFSVLPVVGSPLVPHELDLARVSVQVRSLTGSVFAGRVTTVPTTVTTGNGTLGMFNISFIRNNYRVATNYSVTFAVDGVELTGIQGLRTLVVGAGASYAEKTIVPKLASVQANVENFFYLYLRDAEGNYRASPSLAAETVRVRITKGQMMCPDHVHGNETTYAWDTYPLAKSRLYRGASGPVYERRDVTLDDGSVFMTNAYKVYYTMEETGFFTLNVTVNGISMSCQQVQTFTFNGEPGEADATKSEYEFTTTTVQSQSGSDSSDTVSAVTGPSTSPRGIAGNTYRLKIQLRDIFGQALQRGGAQIQVGTAAGSTPLPPPATQWLTQGPSVPTVSFFDAETSGLLNGIYEVTFSATKVGVYGIHLGLGASGTRILNGPVNMTIAHAEARKLLDIAWTTLDGVNVTTSSVVAGTPLVATIGAGDVYGNQVLTTTGHTITIDVTRSDSTLATPPVALDILRLKPATQPSSTEPGKFTATMTLVWEGKYDVVVQLRSKDGLTVHSELVHHLTVTHQACATATSPATPYRCPDGKTCVDDYANCPGAPTKCPATTPIRCASNNLCVSSVQDCPCAVSGEVRCPAGNCLPPELCLKPSPCPAPLIMCVEGSANKSTGICAKSQADCPAIATCPTGYVICDNGVSCAPTIAACPSVEKSACPVASHHRCPDGRCVAFMEDCVSRVACPANTVYCLSDGSCKPSTDQCLAQTPCLDPAASYRCPTGDCRASSADCPNAVTCPVGWVRCEDGACAESLSMCHTPITCPVTKIRCPDGSCAENSLLCSSQVSCPSEKPIYCADRSCKETVALCSIPRPCPLGVQVCPDGSCVNGTTCAVDKTCPLSTPVLCPDRSCATSIDKCHTPIDCPPANPSQCPDGACRASLQDCPSRTLCPSKSPVRCPDGTCQASLDFCISVISNTSTCPSGTVRCVGGECAASALVCPTHITCPLGTVKCNDGRCAKEADCPTKDNIESCADQGLIQCPLSGAGIACAKSLDGCPAGIVCPSTRPVKCIDSTCAVSLSACPPAPSDTPGSSRKPCPDGSWTLDACPTAVTCPPETPYKCYDQTCRVLPTDCPDPDPCPAATPYRCTNGACEARPWDCIAPVDGSCDPRSDKPVKCPLVNGMSVCANNATACPRAFSQDTTGDRQYCAAGFTRCRDGSCKATAAACAPFECPTSYPLLCPNGACVKNLTRDCLLDNGCPPSAPIKCIGEGSCRPRLALCPRSTCSDQGLLACSDGSCSTTCSRSASGCPTGRVRCFDGTCVSDYAECISRDNKANSCPGNKPVRCSHGLCVESLSSCPVLNQTVCAGSKDGPILCADGSCRDSIELCRLILPCEGNDMVRCDDGTCMDASVDPNTCSRLNTCPASMPVRCKQSLFPDIPIIDGLCARSLSSCYHTNGCPLIDFVPQVRCLGSGRCVPTQSMCSLPQALANGCSSDKPTKCWDGACVTNSTQCTASNGCPFATPFRCSNGTCVTDPGTCVSGDVCSGVLCSDGSCVSSSAECKTLVGCPMVTPIRCADGSCRKFPAGTPLVSTTTAGAVNVTAADVCPAVMSCPSAAQTLCQNGACVGDASECPALPYPCSNITDTDGIARPFLCLDGVTCATHRDACPPSRCPVMSPVLCPNGACAKSMIDCSKATDPQSSTATGPSTRPPCDGKPFICFDGSCKASLRECHEWAVQAGRLTACGTVCGDGTCLSANNPAKCPAVTACAAGQYRCGGACQNHPCGTSVPACAAFEERCTDGVCRPFGKCPHFDGCPTNWQQSYRCPSRECASGPDACLAAASPDPDAWAIQMIIDHARAIALKANMPAGLLNQANTLLSKDKSGIADVDTLNRQKHVDLTKIIAALDTPQVKALLAKGLYTKEMPTTSTSSSSSSSLSSSTPTLFADPDPLPPCTSNCHASEKAIKLSFTYNPTASPYQEVPIAPPSTEMRLRIFSGLNIDSNLDTSIYVDAVPESLVLNATNKVHESRVGGPEKFPRTLTFAQTVLSPLFRCSVGAGIAQPFSQPVQVLSNIDLTRNPHYDDVCLARLRRFPSLNYQVWQCVFTESERKSASHRLGTVTSVTQRFSVKPNPTVQPALVSSQITTCYDPDLPTEPAVYAFIHQPLASRQVYTADTDTFWRDNIVYIMLGGCAALLIICGLVYCVSRLTRYTKKLEDTQKNVEKLREHVQNLTEGGTGITDEAVVMQSNPLAVQVEDIRAVQDPEEQRRRQELLLRQEKESMERQMIIQQQHEQQKRELEHLEALRKQQQVVSAPRTMYPNNSPSLAPTTPVLTASPSFAALPSSPSMAALPSVSPIRPGLSLAGASPHGSPMRTPPTAAKPIPGSPTISSMDVTPRLVTSPSSSSTNAPYPRPSPPMGPVPTPSPTLAPVPAAPTSSASATSTPRQAVPPSKPKKREV